MKRLGIFFFCDADGVVDSYIDNLLQEMNKHLEKLIIVCNGILSPASRKKFLQYSNHILVRKNEGRNAWAYKDALEYLGWEELSGYDELVMFDYTIFGPVYPLEEMFESMSQQDLDFWGVTKFHGRANKGNLEKLISYDFFPAYIEWHFIAVKNRMLNSYEFKQYWDSLKPIRYTSEALGYHEAIFTQQFSDYGFKWDVYADSDFLGEGSSYPSIWQPVELLKNKRCPIVKTVNFNYNSYNGYLYNGTGESSKELFEYIKKETDYDVSLIWDHILRISNMRDVKRCLQLQYVLSSTCSVQEQDNLVVAYIVRISANNCVEKYVEYLKALCNREIIIVVDETILDTITSFLENEKITISKCCVVESGKENYCFAKVLSEIGRQYQYVCCMDFSLEGIHHVRSIEESIVYEGLENTIKSKAYINNILQLFAENERLGMAVTPTPIQADYCKLIGKEWRSSAKIAESLALALKVPFEKEKSAVSPYSGFFWCRTSALKSFIEYIESSDYNNELFMTNRGGFSTLYSVMGIFVQNQKYYSATIMSDEYAKIELTNLRFYLEEK